MEQGNLAFSEETLISEVSRILGMDIAAIVKKDDLLQEVFRQVPWVAGKPLQICLVGSTGVGKSTLVNALFAGRILEVIGIPDTTSAIQRVSLLSGVELIDTPGLGGFEKKTANLTRAFLGLPQKWFRRRVRRVPILDFAEGSPGGPIKRDVSVKAIPRPPDIVLHLIDLKAYREADVSIFRQLTGKKMSWLARAGLVRSPNRKVILIANKVDLLVTDEASLQTHRDKIRKEFEVDPVFVSAKTGEGLNTLVQSLFDQLPVDIRDSFDRALMQRYQRARRDRALSIIAAMVPEAAVTPVDKASRIQNVTHHELLLRALMMRLTLDFSGFGPAAFRGQIGGMLRSVYENIRLQKIVTETVMQPEERVKRVSDWAWKEVGDRSGEGALAGLVSGASLGTAVSPGWGTLIGGILGLIFGAAAGSNAKQKQLEPVEKLVTEVVQVPKRIVRAMPGGVEAAASVVGFGLAYFETLELIEQGRPQTFERLLDRFERFRKQAQTSLKDLEPVMVPSASREELASQVLERIKGLTTIE